MNRLAAPFAPHVASPFASFEFPTGTSLPTMPAPAPRSGASRGRVHPVGQGAALFAPIHYERGYAYPLLIWLHDEGGSERELRRLMPLVSVRNYVGCAARGLASSAKSSACYGWPQTPAGVDAAIDGAYQCIELAKQRFNVHSQRIFLAGHGSGGTMALRLALQMALPVAGVISLNGPLPKGNCPLARVNETRGLPIMLMTCSDSTRYAPPQVVDDLRLLHAAGLTLALRQYLCGDDLYSDMFADMDQWLMERVCGAPAVARA